MLQPAIIDFPSLYCSFLALTSDTCVVFCMKKDRSMSLSPSSMRLEVLVSKCLKRHRSQTQRNLHHRCTDGKHGLPFWPVQRQDGEESLQEWRVEQGKVQRH